MPDSLRERLRLAISEVETDALVTKQHSADLLEELAEQLCPCGPDAPTHTHLEGRYSVQLVGDGPDPELYCPEHGGTTSPELCEDDSHPIPEDDRAPCDCPARAQAFTSLFGHFKGCPRHVPPVQLPTFIASRGGIQYRVPE